MLDQFEEQLGLTDDDLTFWRPAPKSRARVAKKTAAKKTAAKKKNAAAEDETAEGDLS
jgi:hypothetical protein